ncbi:Hsp20/alpha crystallin family protein [Pedobacter sp. BMA]|uniref:Hsp20/alpha crystallin family protein n=1 Tax=Pedobacter sp. BMA TaxID=1663685 RepID=UPI00064A261F|nr:Hsp20/alpha crystallin family protein [Pedobacter sp. BMA]KLT64542.1 hypothetical protein AB669_12285 [Pedobacter sp. BMA]
MYNEHRCHSGKIHSGWRQKGKFGDHHGRKFTRNFEGFFREGFRRVPANIEETNENFIIYLFAPALIKEYLKVNTKDDILTISYSPKETEETIEKFTRREYSNGSFERAFSLNGKVMTDAIAASYTDGILKITLPKNPETNIPAKDIAVN